MSRRNVYSFLSGTVPASRAQDPVLVSREPAEVLLLDG